MEFHKKEWNELDELTEEQLGFSALSKGLGITVDKKIQQRPLDDCDSDEFDSEDKKSLSQSGIGAVSAGPIRVAPNITSKLPKPYVSASAKAYATTGAIQDEVKKQISIPAAAPTATNTIASSSTIQLPAAPQKIRLMAFFLDVAIVLIPFATAWWMGFASNAKSVFIENKLSAFLLFNAILFTYFLLSESFGGQSLGKMFFGLRVVEDDKYEKPTGLKHAVLRIFLLTLGTGLLGAGLLTSFKDKKRRPWHDLYSGSIVRQKD